MDLLTPWSIRDHEIPSRVVFGPHVTNLGNGRSFSERHIAYYERRAGGGAGVIVCEETAVGTDWPYERSPHTDQATDGWARIAEACHSHGASVLAALGHTGLQGSSAYSQRALLAPSAVPDPVSREVPAVALPSEIDELVAQFAAAARSAIDAGCDGVEINIGQMSLLRQFLSGLTNARTDGFGPDSPRGRAEVPLRVLEAVREAIGGGPLLTIRLCVDELAPWAGITPEHAPALVEQFGPLVDWITPVRGSIFSRGATRPDGHVPPGFLRDQVRELRNGVASPFAFVWQGSNVDVEAVSDGLTDGVADAAEMTRALIADPDLVAKLHAGRPHDIRPCTLCNQRCQVLDARNPMVSCSVEPSAGHELEDPAWESPGSGARRSILIVGGGVAGLEAARIGNLRGHSVRVVEASNELGGAARTMARSPGFDRTNTFLKWLVAQVEGSDASIELGRELAAEELESLDDPAVLLAIGGVPGDSIPGPLPTFHASEIIADQNLLEAGGIAHGANIVIWDALGGPTGIAAAELLADRYTVHLVHPDPVAGSQLASSGDLAPASTRMLQAGVHLRARSVVSSTTTEGVCGAERITHLPFELPAAALIVATARKPQYMLKVPERFQRIGDALAPRTIADAILDARRAILSIEGD